MGCGCSRKTKPQNKEGLVAFIEDNSSMRKSEKGLSIKAALFIQRWYRRYRARLEARRRCTWTIFQSLEYAGEQDQLMLYNFFTDMMTHMNVSKKSTDPLNALDFSRPGSAESAHSLPLSRYPVKCADMQEEDDELFRLTDPSECPVELSYEGPRLVFPLTMIQVEKLIDAFKKKELLHSNYLLELLHQVRHLLKRQPNIMHASTSISKQITICGDLHGKIDDLFIVLYKNGLPAVDNPYIFNGDFVDRGPNSVEIAVLLFAFMLCNPNEVYVNRGNHEDHIMNLRYGFIREVMVKYQDHASKVVRLFEEVFSWLPLATIIDRKVLVTHGGVSDKTDLEYLATIDRHKYLSALRPPVIEEADDDSTKERINIKEWRQILDILWSDPKPQKGCKANTFRGGGCYFGPDVTERVLKKHKLQLLIRSHECKPEGYEFMHNNKCLTIFSASNYYEIGSNKGAYIKMTSDLQPRPVQYMASKDHISKRLTVKQRVGLVEDSAIKGLREKICANKVIILEAFYKYDPDKTGKMKVAEWSEAIANAMVMELPWRSLRHHLVKCTDDGMVEYNTMFEQFTRRRNLESDSSTVTDTLYQNKDTLESIFRAIDKDNSGMISLEEFEDACSLLGKYTKRLISKEHVHILVNAIDQNKDGYIDFNEFLEAFRIVSAIQGDQS